MKISDLKPTRSSFKLSITKKEYFLRPMTPNDSVLIEKHVGNLKDTLNSGKFTDIFKIAYLLLEPESTLGFTEKDVTFVDFNGKKIKQKVGGYALFINMLTSIDEQFDVLKACLYSIGVPEKSINELMEKRDEIAGMEITPIEEIKKKVQTKKKKKN